MFRNHLQGLNILIYTTVHDFSVGKIYTYVYVNKNAVRTVILLNTFFFFFKM